MPKYYLIDVYAGIEPSIIGQYETEKLRDEAALKHRKEEQSDEDCLFTLDIADDGTPEVGTYSNGFFMGEDDDGDMFIDAVATSRAKLEAEENAKAEAEMANMRLITDADMKGIREAIAAGLIPGPSIDPCGGAPSRSQVLCPFCKRRGVFGCCPRCGGSGFVDPG
jgi:hypothetical protein